MGKITFLFHSFFYIQYMHELKHLQHHLPLILTLSISKSFLKSSTTKVPKNVTAVFSLWVLKSCIIKSLSSKVYILADLVKQRDYFISFFFGMSIQKVRLKGTQVGEVRQKDRERCKGLEVHSCLWGAVPAQRWMRSFREQEGRQSWDRKVLVSYWQS